MRGLQDDGLEILVSCHAELFWTRVEDEQAELNAYYQTQFTARLLCLSMHKTNEASL